MDAAEWLQPFGFRSGRFQFLSSSPAEIVHGGQRVLYMHVAVCRGGCSGPAKLQMVNGGCFPVTRIQILTQTLCPVHVNLSIAQIRADHPRNICSDVSGGRMPCSAAPQLNSPGSDWFVVHGC